MKIYFVGQIEKRALEVFGSEEKLEEEREKRDEKRIIAKTKKYNKNIKGLYFFKILILFIEISRFYQTSFV